MLILDNRHSLPLWLSVAQRNFPGSETQWTGLDGERDNEPPHSTSPIVWSSTEFILININNIIGLTKAEYKNREFLHIENVDIGVNTGVRSHPQGITVLQSSEVEISKRNCILDQMC